MAQAGRDEAGNYFLSDDGGETWKPAPLGKDEAGQTFYHDGTDWKPLDQTPATQGTEGGVASGGASPAARAPGSDPLSSARAAPPAEKPLPTSRPPQSGEAPYAESVFGAPPTPTGFLPWDTLREYPYNLESNARAGGRMAIHGQNAVREGKPSGVIGEMAGTAGFIGSPLSALFNPVSRPVHDMIGNPAERLTGIPGTADVVTAGVLAAPGLIPAGPRAPRMGEMPEASPPAPPKVSAPGTINLHPSEYSEGPMPPHFHDRSANYKRGANDGGRPDNFVPDPMAAGSFPVDARYGTEPPPANANQPSQAQPAAAPSAQAISQPLPVQPPAPVAVPPVTPPAGAISALKVAEIQLGKAQRQGSSPKVVADLEAQIARLRTSLGGAAPEPDTRGQGKFFHGTSTPIDGLTDYYGGDTSYYGRGLYTSDATDIARGYTRKGRGGQPTLYPVEGKGGKFFDMEGPIPDWLSQRLQQSNDDLVSMALEEEPKNLRELYDGIRTASAHEGVSTIEVQNTFDEIAAQLEQKGFSGLQHTGGLRTGKKPHTVQIHWTPSQTAALGAPIGNPPVPPAGAPPGGAGGPPQQPPAGAAPPPGPPQPPATPPAPVPPSAMAAIRTSVNRLKALIDPTGIDAHSKLAESLFREHVGVNDRDTAITAAALEAQQRRVNAMTPVQRYDLFRYIQSRTGGAALYDPALQPLADAMRDAAQLREQKLRAMSSTAQMSFQQDYLEQLWKDPLNRVQQVYGGGRQGSGRFTKGKTFPTIDDGIAAGLTLKSDNPIEMTMNYVTNTDRFIALNAIRDEAKTLRVLRYYRPGRGRPPPDWVPLQGRLGTRNTPAGPMQAYAPESFARIWNNFVSQGMHAQADWGHAYDIAMRAKNAVQQLEFAASGYHAFTIAMKAPAVDLGLAIQAGSRLKGKHTLEALSRTLTSPVTGPAVYGRHARDIYLGRKAASPVDKAIVDLLTRANHRFVGLDKGGEYTLSPARDYWTSWKNGALAHERAIDAAAIRAAPVLGGSQVVMRHLGRTLRTMQKPIFEHYIPLVKNGAAFNAMKQWYETHPNATDAQRLKAARDISDNLDNMMGELNHDNLFWPRMQKQIAQFFLTSFSWKFGGGRWFGGAAYDLGKVAAGNEVSFRAATAIAYGITLATIAGIFNKLMTGEDPQGMDFVMPRTGGRIQQGRNIVAERMQIPGMHKDLLGWYYHPGTEFWNSLNRPIHLAAELGAGTDWRNDPLAPKNATTPQWLAAYFNHIIEGVSPISFQSLGKGPKGTNISPLARAVGFREAGMQYSNPRGFHQWQKKQNDNAYRAKARHDRTSDRQYKGPDD